MIEFKSLRVLILISLALALGGCDPAAVVAIDANLIDAGGADAGRDAGGTDAPRADTGPGDPCAETMMGAPAAARLGCNGPVVGPTRTANSQGGACTMDSCTEPMSACRADGYCQVTCNPGTLYVSTGGCPSGSRCFPVGGGGGLCYIDCNTAADCPIPGSTCDGEFSCIPPAPAADAGVSDGGVGIDAGGLDAGVLDGGVLDGGVDAP